MLDEVVRRLQMLVLCIICTLGIGRNTTGAKRYLAATREPSKWFIHEQADMNNKMLINLILGGQNSRLTRVRPELPMIRQLTNTSQRCWRVLRDWPTQAGSPYAELGWLAHSLT